MDNVIFISTRTGKGTITLNSAGEEQLAICAPIVYLTADVSGDLTNVPTEWVQISGTPTVTLENVDKTNSFYVTGTNVGSDKVFRFYVYRNTQLEQYKDVIVRTTPSDTLTQTNHGKIQNDAPIDPMLLITDPEVGGDFAFDTSIAFNSEGRWITDTLLVSIPLPRMFTDTNDPLYNANKDAYIQIIVEEWNGSSWTYLTAFDRLSSRTLELNTAKKLRYGIQYLMPGKGVVTYYSKAFDYSLGSLSIIVGKEVLSPLYHGMVANDSIITKIVYTIITLEQTDTIPVINTGIVVNDFNLARIIYAILEQDGLDTMSVIYPGTVSSSFNITRTSGTSIGG